MTVTLIHKLTCRPAVKQQTGFSLIELLVASAIGMFITIGVMSLYISNKDTYRLQESMSYVQRNGNFALDRLRRKVQEAGYSAFYPSFTDGVENVLNTNTDDRWDITQPIMGFNNVDAATAYLGITGLIAGSDAVALKTMRDTANLVTNASGSSIVIDSDSGFAASDIAIVTDQDQASMFQISAIDTSVAGQTGLTINSGTTPQPGNSGTLASSYGNNTTVGKLDSVIYYLKTGDNGRPALFEARLITDAALAPTMDEHELISNVEDIQIVYGVDTDLDGDIDRYDTANTVDTNSHWPNVKNIGLTLLLASENANVASTASSYTFNQEKLTFIRDTTTATGADKRIRRPFTTYITMKN